jgi:hypothetical protein
MTPPEPAGEPRLVRSGGTMVRMMPLRYGEEIFRYVGVYKLRDDRIARSTGYFGAPFPAQEFRAPYTNKG